MITREIIDASVDAYAERMGRKPLPKLAMIDMDGVLYDSMKYHTLAWKRMTDEIGLDCTREEFYLYEGMTGAATIKYLYEKYGKATPVDEEIKRLYTRKTELFKQYGKKEMMPNADRMLSALRDAGLRRILVTGSGQGSLLDEINRDYPGIFLDGDRITAYDVSHGKPHPEPYLKGLERASAEPWEALVVENAPLGVKAGHDAGCFTIAVATGPIPQEELYKAGADLVFSSMAEWADMAPTVLDILRK